MMSAASSISRKLSAVTPRPPTYPTTFVPSSADKSGADFLLDTLSRNCTDLEIARHTYVRGDRFVHLSPPTSSDILYIARLSAMIATCVVPPPMSTRRKPTYHLVAVVLQAYGSGIQCLFQAESRYGLPVRLIFD